MRNTTKKIFSIVAATACLGAAFSFVGCNGGSYKTELDGNYLEGTVSSNGGFVVEKGDYVYFINGVASYSDNNTYGEVTKGALMRISKDDLKAGKNTAQTVISALMVSQNMESGIFMYDNTIYFATPTTEKDESGNVQNTWLDFKSATLTEKGVEVKKDYYFQLSSNSTKFRFVEVDGEVYCMYVEGTTLKSFKCDGKTKEATVLVQGASSDFFFDKNNVENANVYYTMGVTYGAGTKYQSTASYNQIYCVNAATTVTVNDKDASYTVNGTKTYSFDKAYLEDEVDTFDAKDITTYPYVNAGTLVLDGIGSKSTVEAQYNWDSEQVADASTPDGYTYSISSYQNGGLYFTRTDINTVTSAVGNTWLRYLADDKGSDWNTITGNESDKIETVALDTTNASASAIYFIEDGRHGYLYLSGEALYKEYAPVDGKAEKINMAQKVGTPTLWTLEGDYLYYYSAGTNGNNVARINYKGTADDYNPLKNQKEYQPITLSYIDWNSSWYMPEFVGDMLLYSNAQSFGSYSYNYIYAAPLGTTDAIQANLDSYDEVNEFIESYTNNAALQTVMQYYFRTGETELFDNVANLYDDYQKEEFKSFQEDYKDNLESKYYYLIGELSEDDAEAIETSFADSLRSETKEEEEEESMPTWAIVLIVVASVLVVAGGVVAFLLWNKQKKEKAAREAATVNAYKNKIDTTDDKSIDVYADDEAETTEVSEEVAEETVEAVEETCEACHKCHCEQEVVEEAVEEVAEEATEEEKQD